MNKPITDRLDIILGVTGIKSLETYNVYFYVIFHISFNMCLDTCQDTKRFGEDTPNSRQKTTTQVRKRV